MTGKRGRLLMLLSQLAYKLKDANLKDVRFSSAVEKFNVLGRLTRAYATGRYRDIPWKNFLLIVAAILYFVSPIDLLPDMLPITGFTDDLGVLMWVYHTVNKEIDKFLTWEKSQLTT